MTPLLSIVVANYNYGRFLETALQSVFSQDGFDQCELIVCDAASTDNSVEIIKKYADRIAWWCSEKDKGQSDAFNKGFSHATGRFLTWLNADDIMMPGIVRKLQVAAQESPDVAWFTAGTVWLNPDGKPFRCVRARPFSKFLLNHGHIPVWGPSSFFKRELFERTNGFKVHYHYMMDTDLWFRFHYDHGAAYQLLPGYAFGLRVHPAAKTSGYRFKDSEMNDAQSKGRLAQQAESDDMRMRYPTKPIGLFSRILHFGWIVRVLEIADLVEMRRRHAIVCA